MSIMLYSFAWRKMSVASARFVTYAVSAAFAILVNREALY
jgi:hypothetical protein